MSDHLVIVALDFDDPSNALNFAKRISPDQCALKVGFELFVSGGPSLVEKLVSLGFKVFLDLKFHDIPNTVAKACAAATRLGVWMMNVHASGGSEMLAAARDAVEQATDHIRPQIIAVTVLTSMDKNGLNSIGITDDVVSVVRSWAMLANEAGLDGVVSSAREAEMIRKDTHDDFVIVTPGIRMPSDATKDDQKRIVTPEDARTAGVSHIVVGRPITKSADPMRALENFYQAFSCE